MDTSALRLTQSVKKEELEKLGFRFEHDTADHGWLDNMKLDQFPYYYTDGDTWSPSSHNDPVEKSELLFELGGGLFQLTDLDVDTVPYLSFAINSYPEFLQFLLNMEKIGESDFEKSKKLIRIPLSDIIEEVCISINFPDPEHAGFGTETFRFVRIADLQAAIGKQNTGRALRAAFDHDPEAMKYIGDWSEFCATKGLAEKLDSFHISEFPLLAGPRVITNCSTDLTPKYPVIGFKLNPEFSVQYLFDYFTNYLEGENLLSAIKREVKKNGEPGNHFVHAPKGLYPQILHSLVVREQTGSLQYHLSRLAPSRIKSVKYHRELTMRRKELVAGLCEQLKKEEAGKNDWPEPDYD